MRYASGFVRSSQSIVVTFALVLASAVAVMAQRSGGPPAMPPPIAPPQQQVGPPPDVWQQQQQKGMEKQANLQRQQDIKKDTAKLLELATELKQAVDKSSENTLSLDVVKKAEQIEKLAKSVKEKMKGP